MRHLRIFARGLGRTILAIGLGCCVARYIPSLWIGVASLLLLLAAIYVAGLRGWARS